METMTKTSRPNWRIVHQIMKVLFPSELLGRYCMNNVLHHLAISSGKKWTCISISPLLYRQQHSIWSLFPLPWKPMGNLQFSANLSASLVQSSCCLAHTLCQAIAEQWFASRWFGVNYYGIIMHYQLVFFHCSFSLRLLYYVLYFKCCCNCMAFLFQEAASWGWWSIWPLTCLWRSFPTSHTILEACPPLVPQSNHLRKSLFYAKGNWTTLMAGMLTLRCSLPKGEWHAERGECLATPVPEVPLAKLNAFF